MESTCSTVKNWKYEAKAFTTPEELHAFLEEEEVFEQRLQTSEFSSNELQCVSRSADITHVQTDHGSAFSTPSSFLRGRWLFLAVPLDKDHPQKRNREFNDFQKRCRIENCRITRRDALSPLDVKTEIINFLEHGGEEDIPDSIILLGHGAEKEHPCGLLDTKDGHLSNESIIQHIEEWLEQNTQRKNKTNLCLYYCRAADGVICSNAPSLTVTVYEKIQRKIDGSVKREINPKTKHFFRKETAENSALVDLAKRHANTSLSGSPRIKRKAYVSTDPRQESVEG